MRVQCCTAPHEQPTCSLGHLITRPPGVCVRGPLPRNHRYSDAFEAADEDASSRVEGDAQVAAITAGLHEGEIANIQFTSGTTGLPKAVVSASVWLES